jgi:predicted HTH domain antitoxin
MLIQLSPNFYERLEPYGSQSAEFFLAASLYHAHKVSFGAAASLAKLGFDEFHYR